MIAENVMASDRGTEARFHVVGTEGRRIVTARFPLQDRARKCRGQTLFFPQQKSSRVMRWRAEARFITSDGRGRCSTSCRAH